MSPRETLQQRSRGVAAFRDASWRLEYDREGGEQPLRSRGARDREDWSGLNLCYSFRHSVILPFDSDHM